jgi:hypothetical protein
MAAGERVQHERRGVKERKEKVTAEVAEAANAGVAG